MTTRTSASYRLTLTVGLCFLVALMEGLDLQAAGIAAVGIAHAFALDKMQMGWIFSAGILGLLPGALVGCWPTAMAASVFSLPLWRCSACSRWRRRFPGISHRWCLPV